MNGDHDPVPKYFSMRYIWWVIYSNAITILATIQLIFQGLTLDPTMLDHKTVHWVDIFNMVLMIIVAQAKKNDPSPPSPRAAETPLVQPAETPPKP